MRIAIKMTDGWIKLHRDIFKHWIFDDAEYFRAWLYIVGNAAFDETKQKVGKKIVLVKRGELIISEKRLCEIFKWGTTKLRNFIDTLISENMLQKEIINKKSKFIVVKYELYQKTESENRVISECEQSDNRVLNKNIRNKESINLFHKLIQDGFEIQKDFIPVIEQWLDYKKDKKQTYKNEASLKAFYKKLLDLSGESPEIAQKIIEQSMANNWAGIFELKNAQKTEANKPKDNIEELLRLERG